MTARAVQDCSSGKFRRTSERSTGGQKFEKFKSTNEAVQKTQPRYATQSSLGALAREVQEHYRGKFRRTNEGSTGGRNFGKFKCTNEAI
jgi:hypothetical protein